jgi:hypothetical protein
MAELTLEQEVADLKARNQTTGVRWWEKIGRPMSSDELEAFEKIVAYGQYFRKTGKDAPPDWKPGDPIPESAEI